MNNPAALEQNIQGVYHVFLGPWAPVGAACHLSWTCHLCEWNFAQGLKLRCFGLRIMGKQQGLSDFFLLKLQCVLYTPLSDTPSSSKQGMFRHLQGTAPRKQSWIAGILWIRCTGRINMHANRAAALNSSIKGFTWIYCTLTFITFQLFFTSFTRFYKGNVFLRRRLPGSMTTPAWPKL